MESYLVDRGNRVKTVLLDFKHISSWREYGELMERELQFPRPIEGNTNRFLDWIRDLSWYHYDAYNIIFYNFKKLSTKNFRDAYKIYMEFDQIVLPFWEHDAVRCIVDGKRKDFNVYIVE